MISVLLKLRKHQVLIRIGNHHPPQSDSSLSHGSTGIHALDHELLGSVGPIFGRLHFYFKDSNSVKMSFFFRRKKNTDSRKKLRLQLVTVSLLACLLLEKKKHPKKEKHTASYGASANMGLLRGVIGWVTCSMPWFHNVAVDDLGFKKKC